MAAPRGSFVLREGDGPVVLLSAGIGATPVLAMLHALAAGHTTREVWWLHGARNSRTHPFAAEVRSLLGGLSRVHHEIWYSASLPDDRMGVDYTRLGRLDADALRRLHLPADADAYVCGPAHFMQSTRESLTEIGVAPTRISTEVFGATAPINPGVVAEGTVPPHPPAGPPGHGPEVAFARSGLRVPWGDGSTSLLELAEACDVPTRWSCRTGICHTCETGLLSGSVTHDPPPIDPPASGNVLICCAVPREPVVLDL
ncbi:flavin reductase family protein [Nakamurella sp. GG22]